MVIKRQYASLGLGTEEGSGAIPQSFRKSKSSAFIILHCPATDSLRRSLFGDSLSLYGLWSKPWGVARLLGLHGLPLCPIPRKGSGNNNNNRQALGFQGGYVFKKEKSEIKGGKKKSGIGIEAKKWVK